jgi:hypothetical protein
VVSLLVLGGCNVNDQVADNALGFAVDIGGEYRDVLTGDLDVSTLDADQRQLRIDRIDSHIDAMRTVAEGGDQ